MNMKTQKAFDELDMVIDICCDVLKKNKHLKNRSKKAI